jgi:hypothetical protein
MTRALPFCLEAAPALAGSGHQVLVRRSVQFHLTDWFNE